MNTRNPHALGFRNKLARAVWGAVHPLLLRPSPRTAHRWRRFWLNVFGAKVAHGCLVYRNARIWAPWHLEMAAGAVIGDGVEVYNVAPVRLGAGAVVSQRAFLCTASHDFRRNDFRLVAGAITIDEGAWVAAEAYVAPGVEIGAFAIVGARAVATKDVAPDTIVTGNPARYSGARPSVTVAPGAVLAGIAQFQEDKSSRPPLISQ